MQLLDDLKETEGYCKLKQEALDRTCGEIDLKEAVDLSKTDCRMKECVLLYRLNRLAFLSNYTRSPVLIRET